MCRHFQQQQCEKALFSQTKDLTELCNIYVIIVQLITCPTFYCKYFPRVVSFPLFFPTYLIVSSQTPFHHHPVCIRHSLWKCKLKDLNSSVDAGRWWNRVGEVGERRYQVLIIISEKIFRSGYDIESSNRFTIHC